MQRDVKNRFSRENLAQARSGHGKDLASLKCLLRLTTMSQLKQQQQQQQQQPFICTHNL